jgi:hypothetical protein
VVLVACFAWTEHREQRRFSIGGQRHSRKMSSFSINAILGTRTYEDSQAFDTQNLKSESYPIQKTKPRRLTDTDDDEGVWFSICFTQSPITSSVLLLKGYVFSSEILVYSAISANRNDVFIQIQTQTMRVHTNCRAHIQIYDLNASYFTTVVYWVYFKACSITHGEPLLYNRIYDTCAHIYYTL